MRSFFISSLLVVSFAAAALGEESPGAKGVSSALPRQFGAPRLRTMAAAPVVASLGATTAADIAAMRSANARGDGPAQIGVVRELTAAYAVGGNVSAAATERMRWHGTVRVDGARGVRLRLDGVQLSPDAVLWVYGRSGEAIGFDASTAYQGTLWTPTIEGDAITLEVDAKQGGSFRIGGVADIRADAEVTTNGTECFSDVACHGATLNEWASGVARYTFAKSGVVYLCTGTLINAGSTAEFEPYFLTANHCVSTASEAASVETYWDYRAPTCNGVSPSLASRPRASGASLLVSSSATDVTLLRLASVPGGQRWYMGWSTAALSHGTPLYRISHPSGTPARYTSMTVDTAFAGCSSSPKTSYVYTQQIIGGTAGGSSGSAAVNAEGQIVGQLKSGCGPNVSDSCDTRNRDVDGLLSQSFPLLQPYLRPDVTQCGACTPSDTTACILGNRFKVTVRWTNRFASPAASGDGKLIRYADNRPDVSSEHGPMSEIAFFSFFPNAPGAIESMVRMINGVGINDKYWVLITGFANVEYTVTVTDTRTCATWTRTNPNGTYPMITDLEAFARP